MPKKIKKEPSPARKAQYQRAADAMLAARGLQRKNPLTTPLTTIESPPAPALPQPAAPIIPASLDPAPLATIQVSNNLTSYLRDYLSGPKSIKDFNRLRKHSPKDALLIAIERVWGAKVNAKKNNEIKGLGVLIKILTGIPSRDIDPLPVVVEPIKDDEPIVDP